MKIFLTKLLLLVIGVTVFIGGGLVALLQILWNSRVPKWVKNPWGRKTLGVVFTAKWWRLLFTQWR